MSDQSCLCLRTNWTHLPLKIDLWGTYTCGCPVWLICFDNFTGWEHPQRNIGLLVSCSPYFPPYWIDTLAPKWRQRLLSLGSLATQFEIPLYRAKWHNFVKSACKIVNFNHKHPTLWNRVFQTVYFNMWKKISLHRHSKKAGKTLYSLRVLRRAGLCQASILTIYLSTVRPVLEYAVPVSQAIPAYLPDAIERIHIRALYIIYPEAESYGHALQLGELHSSNNTNIWLRWSLLAILYIICYLACPLLNDPEYNLRRKSQKYYLF